MSPVEPIVQAFYDGDCPLCRREMAWLMRRNADGKVTFTNIASEKFSPDPHGPSPEELMREFHVRLGDGTWRRGVEAFRILYAALGFRRWAAISRWPGLAQTLELGYRLFARYRLRLTGRCASGGVCRVPQRGNEAP